MEHVFVVQHVKEVDDLEDVKMIGVYSTRALAAEVVVRLVSQPGFRDYPDGFHIGLYPLDKDHWTEGFINWDDAAS